MSEREGRVVVLIPCYNDEDTIAETVEVFRRNANVSEVIVIDDASTDESALRAAEGRARVVVLPHNLGKAGALAAGIEVEPDADIYLLIDSDTGASAHEALRLLLPLEHGEAEMAIGVLPAAGKQGGFGAVKRFARWGIARACGYVAEAPLSGQRAVRGDVLRSVTLAHRFGVEVAMTIDAVRAGARVVELPVEMTHKHRGRSFEGFRHRARQGRDVAAVLWQRIVPRLARRGLLAMVTVIALLACWLISQANSETPGGALPHSGNVRIALIVGGGWDDNDHHLMLLPQEKAIAGSMSTGDVHNVVSAVASGSRDKDAPRSPDVSVEVVLQQPVAKPGEVIIIAGITTTKLPQRLRPVTISGLDVEGTLTSTSTHRRGYVDLTDLAPTALAMQGKPVPETMTGMPMQLLPDAPNLTKLAEEAAFVRVFQEVRLPIVLGYSLLQLMVYLVARQLSRQSRDLPFLGSIAVAIASFPLATYLVRWIVGAHPHNVWAWSAFCALAMGMIVAMWFRAARRPAVALQTLLLATVFFIIGDLLLGAHLQVGGVFGSSALLAARYFGLGNPASAVLLSALVLSSALHVQHARHRNDALAHVVAGFVIVTAIVGMPGLGSDVGGLIAFTLTGVVLVTLLTRKTLNAKVITAGVGGTLIAVTAMALLDYLRPAADRTHLGQLIARIVDSGEGFAPLREIISRKVEANIFGYGFPASLAVSALAVLVLISLVLGRWANLLPIGSPTRAGVLAAVIGGLIIYAVNDSGIVMIALLPVFLGPLLLVQHQMRHLLNNGSTPKLEVSVPCP